MTLPKGEYMKNNVAAIKAFFEANGGRKVSMEEFRALSTAERNELGQLCAAALGVTIEGQ
jgi:hypothetical protein